MSDTSQRGAAALISCCACGAHRGTSQAQGEERRQRLPRYRGRHPHPGIFTEGGRQAESRIMLVGASNPWLTATQLIIDMSYLNPEGQKHDRPTVLGRVLGENLESARENLRFIHALLKQGDADAARLRDLDDDELTGLLRTLPPATENDDDRPKRRKSWGPMDLLVPGWNYLLTEPPGDHHEDRDNGLVVSPRSLGDVPAGVSRVLTIDRLRRVNAVLGFTRVDDCGRVEDSEARLVSLIRFDRSA